jgi:asparagine synthase (glutamine-hydrolysing)
MAPTAEPFSTLMCLVTAAEEQTLIARHAASATFTGDGGDCAFGSFCIGEAAVAYLRRRGPRPAVVRLAAESASVLGQTTWHALKRALQMWLTGRSLTSLASLNREARSLVTDEVVRECEAAPAVHPWLTGLQHVPWEPMSKLGMLLGTLDLYAGQAQPSAAGPEIVTPIYAQPLVELVLRIPADVLFQGGQDRGLARHAFRGDVAQPILNRLWKDRAGDFPRRDHSPQPRLAARGLPRRRARWRRLSGQGGSRTCARPGLGQERCVSGRAVAAPGHRSLGAPVVGALQRRSPRRLKS